MLVWGSARRAVLGWRWEVCEHRVHCVWLCGCACELEGLVTVSCVGELLGVCVLGVICVHLGVSLYIYKC